MWAAFCKRNPRFLTGDPPICFTVESVRKFFDCVWDQAVKESRVESGFGNDFMRMFGGIR